MVVLVRQHTPIACSATDYYKSAIGISRRSTEAEVEGYPSKLPADNYQQLLVNLLVIKVCIRVS